MLESILLFIQTHVGHLNGWITTALHGNSIVAGAATASIIASLFYVLRKIPSNINILLRKKLLYTYTLEYMPFANMSTTDLAKNFEVIIQKHISKKRNQSNLTIVKKKLVESLSYGSFLYYWDNFFIIVNRSVKTDSDKSDSTNQIIILNFTTFVWNRKKFIDKFNVSANNYTGNKVYRLISAGYGSTIVNATIAAPIDTTSVLVMEKEAKRKIDDAIDNFLLHREDNNRKGAKHKLVLMLHGEPGTGKSSVGEYIAKRLHTSLFCVNNTSLGSGSTDNLKLSNIVDAARDNITTLEVPVVLCDDFDTIWKCNHRSAPSQTKGMNGEVMDGYESSNVGMLLSDLQSPTEIRDCVVIFTINDLSKIDTAIYRPGRVNLLLEISRMSPNCVKEYFQLRYETKWPEEVMIDRALRGCDISNYYISNVDNPQGFINAVCGTGAEDEQFQEDNQLIVAQL